MCSNKHTVCVLQGTLNKHYVTLKENKIKGGDILPFVHNNWLMYYRTADREGAMPMHKAVWPWFLSPSSPNTHFFQWLQLKKHVEVEIDPFSSLLNNTFEEQYGNGHLIILYELIHLELITCLLLQIIGVNSALIIHISIVFFSLLEPQILIILSGGKISAISRFSLSNPEVRIDTAQGDGGKGK